MSAEGVQDFNANDHDQDEKDLENGNPESRGVKRQRTSTAAADDDDDDDDKPGRERRKIEIKFIQDKSRRHITFSKRKAGIMKKVRSHNASMRRDFHQSHHHTNVFHRHTNCRSSQERKCFYWSCPRPASSTRLPHPSCSHSSPSPKARISSRYVPHHHYYHQPSLTFIQACLNAPEPADSNGVEDGSTVESPEEPQAAPPPMPQNIQQRLNTNQAPQQPYMTADQQQALQYQAYLQQQQQAAQQGAYPMPPQQQMHSRG